MSSWLSGSRVTAHDPHAGNVELEIVCRGRPLVRARNNSCRREQRARKTSIVQALDFALFGGSQLAGPARSPVQNAIRGNSPSAEVRCTLEVAGLDVAIRRTVSRVTGRSIVASKFRVDGREWSESQWLELMERSFGLDAPQLSRIAILPEGFFFSPNDAGTDIASALESVFGVRRLRESASQLEQYAVRLERDTDSSRRDLRDSVGRVERTRRDVLEQQASGVQQSLSELQGQLALIHDAQSRGRAWSSYRERLEEVVAAEQHLQDVRALLREQVEQVLATDVDEGRSLIDAVSVARDELVAQRAETQTAKAIARQALEDLVLDSAVCPTCLRPLSPAERADAQSQHEARIEAADDRLDQISERMGHVDALWSDVLDSERRRAPSRPDRPEVEEPSGLEPDVTALEAEAARQTAELAAVRADIAAIESAHRLRDEDERLSRQLRAGYRRVERAHVLSSTMTSLADSICAERIAPLARQVEIRWPDLWPGESISMAASGALGLGTHEWQIPFSEFSGGQRTIAQILVRLLALQMATACPFLILDEPLEHLDPHHRRALVTLLVKAGVVDPTSSMKQIIVTTYEETVARRASHVVVSSDVTSDPSTHIRYIQAANSDPSGTSDVA